MYKKQIINSNRIGFIAFSKKRWMKKTSNIWTQHSLWLDFDYQFKKSKDLIGK